MDARWLWKGLLVFVGLAAGGLAAWCEPVPAADDAAAFKELQRLAARRAPYSAQLGNRVVELVMQVWDKPLYRHRAAHVLNMNDGYLDGAFNRACLDSLDPKERDLPNFARVDERLYRGGQPTEAGFRRLRELGVRTVVNLRAEDGTEAPLVGSLGLEYVWLPMPDTNPPRPDQVEQFLGLVRRGPGAVYVHCAAGVNRTGTMAAVWRMENGTSPGKALAEAVSYGFNEALLDADRAAEFIRAYRRR